MQKWEYQFLSFVEHKFAWRLNGGTGAEDETLDEYSNKLGIEGWEMVSYTPIPHQVGGDTFIKQIEVVFKRPKFFGLGEQPNIREVG